MVDNLLHVFEKATEKYLDQISSDDDEIAVEFVDKDATEIKHTKKRTEETTTAYKRKPMLVAQTDEKRDRSLSENSFSSKSISYESLDKVSTKTTKLQAEKAEKVTKKQSKSGKVKRDKSECKKEKVEEKKEKVESKKEKSEPKKEKTDSKRSTKENKYSKTKKSVRKEKKKSPVRSRSSSRSPPRSDRSSPPPSWPPSSPDIRFYRKDNKKRHSQDRTDSEDSLPKGRSY